MADPRFFAKSRHFTLGQLAEMTGGTVQGEDAEVEIKDVAPLAQAAEGDIAFLDNRKYIDALKATHARACILQAKDAVHAPAGCALLIHPQPYAAYAVVAGAFYPESLRPAEPLAAGIDPTAEIEPTAQVHPSAVVGANAEIHAGAVVHPGAVIGRGVIVGRYSTVGAHAVLSHAIVGEHVILHPGVKIGQDGFGFAPSPAGLTKVPQLGRVLIGNHVEIGANTTIDRGTSSDTVIGDHTKIDNLVQIGHNVQTGKYCIIVSQTGVSGSTVLGHGVVLGGQVGVAGHLHLGDKVQVAAQSGVMHDLAAGKTYGGSPAIPVLQWHRQTVAVAKLITKE